VAFSAKRAVAGMSVLNGVAMVGAAAQAIVIARAFGTSRLYDLYLLVVVLPELLMIFTQNLFAALLLPLFHKLQAEESEEAAWRKLWNVGNVALLSYAAAAAALFIFARPVAALLVEGGTPAEIAYGAAILRVFAPALGVSLLLRTFLSLHNALESFVFPAVTNLLPPLFVTTAVLVFAVRLGPIAIAVGAVAACAAQVLFLTTRVISRGLRYWRPTLHLRDATVKLFFAWAAPLAFGAAAEQLCTFIDRQVTATLGLEGAISALKYGFVLSSFTIAFFSVPLVRVAFTHLSRGAARAAREENNARYNQVMRQLIVFYVAASVGLILLGEPVMGFLYRGGRFTAASLALAKPAVAAYAAGMLFLVSLNLIRIVAYSYKRYLGYSLIAMGAVALTLGADLTAARLLGYWGVALARGVVAFLWAAATYFYLHRVEGLRLRAGVAVTSGKALAAAALMAAGVWWLSHRPWGIGGPARLEPFVVAISCAAAGGALYFGALLLFREGEVTSLAASLWSKVASRLRPGGRGRP